MIYLREINEYTSLDVGKIIGIQGSGGSGPTKIFLEGGAVVLVNLAKSEIVKIVNDYNRSGSGA